MKLLTKEQQDLYPKIVSKMQKSVTFVKNNLKINM